MDIISKDSLISSGKFAKLTNLNRSALIFYDEHGLFSPKMRGENGYRYYYPRQITMVKFLTLLRTLDIPLKKIRELVSRRSPETLLELFTEQERLLSAEIRRLRRAKKIISSFHESIQEGLAADETVISVQNMKKRKIHIGPRNNFDSKKVFFDSFLKFCGETAQGEWSTDYQIGGIFDDMGQFLKSPGQPSNFFTLDPDGREVIEAGRYLVGYTRGYYGETNDLPGRMAAHAEKIGLKFSGPVYNVYLHDEVCVADPDNYLLQVFVAVRAK
ncbi:MAG: MerR family transcriptional regulator [Oscillospiraceae bacterium]|jgi:DNA-binding transcriptional MerR regulator|nr:MerR family transcriptional regulator [Oscillospiraceae bacterium]